MTRISNRVGQIRSLPTITNDNRPRGGHRALSTSTRLASPTTTSPQQPWPRLARAIIPRTYFLGRGSSPQCPASKRTTATLVTWSQRPTAVVATTATTTSASTHSLSRMTRMRALVRAMATTMAMVALSPSQTARIVLMEAATGPELSNTRPKRRARIATGMSPAAWTLAMRTRVRVHQGSSNDTRIPTARMRSQRLNLTIPMARVAALVVQNPQCAVTIRHPRSRRATLCTSKRTPTPPPLPTPHAGVPTRVLATSSRGSKPAVAPKIALFAD
mmetsp:Transcript_19350/g.45271  ORF Transcript_19350/g.45271 Transcript_19350/m.45271 type:complete len:274 (-) Transcript_19350:350-1171(-)